MNKYVNADQVKLGNLIENGTVWSRVIEISRTPAGAIYLTTDIGPCFMVPPDFKIRVMS